VLAGAPGPRLSWQGSSGVQKIVDLVAIAWDRCSGVERPDEASTSPKTAARRFPNTPAVVLLLGVDRNIHRLSLNEVHSR